MLRFDLTTLKPLIIFIPLLILQLTVIPIISIEGIAPDLSMILLVFYTLKRGRMWGLIAAAIFGFFYDMVSGNALGSTMFSQSIAIFVAGLFFKEQHSERYISNYKFSLILFLCAIINSVVFTFLANYDTGSSILAILLRQGILPAIYTSLIGGIVSVFYPKRGLM